MIAPLRLSPSDPTTGANSSSRDGLTGRRSFPSDASHVESFSTEVSSSCTVGTAGTCIGSQEDSKNWNQDCELHLCVDLTNINRVEIMILEARVSNKEPTLIDHLYDPPFFDAFSTGINEFLGLEEPELLMSKTDIHELQEQHFWVEIIVPPSANAVNLFRTCIALSPAKRIPSALGQNTYFCYQPVWNEAITVDLSMFAINRPMAMNTKLRPRTTLDRKTSSYLNAVGQNAIQLTMIMYMNGVSIGEISLPIKTLNTHEAWYPLNPVDRSFLARLHRTALRQPKWTPGINTKIATYNWPSLPPLRKSLSLRSVFVLIMFMQLAIVVIATTCLMYFTAELQLRESASILSAQIWDSIQGGLIRELRMVELLLYTISGAFYVNNLTQDEILSDLFRAFIELRDNHVNINTSLLYVATEDNTIYGCGYNRSLLVPGVKDSDVYFVIKNTTLGPSLGYRHTSGCSPFDPDCNIVDYGAPCCRNLTNFTTTLRPWFPIAANSVIPRWTDVYITVTGDRSYTNSFRVPNVLTLPVRYIVAVDVFLTNIDSHLSSLGNHDHSRYSVAWDINNGFIMGSSLHGSTDPVVDGKGVRLTESRDPRIRALGDYITEHCAQNLPLWTCTTDTGYVTLKILENSVTMGPLGSDTVPIMIAVVISQTSFLKEFRNSLTIAMLVSWGLVGIMVCVTVGAAHILTRHIAACTKQLKRFAVLDFTQPVLDRHLFSPVKELCRINEALCFIRFSLRSFFKFVPPDVVRQVVNSGEVAQLANNKKKIITVMFSDILDFTRLSENMELDNLMTILRCYFEEMSSIILHNEGTVDKYIGDAIMVLFNAPETVIHHPIKACETALLCQARLSTLAPEWQKRGFPYVQAHIGIHTGTCIVGNFGSDTRLNYTALGDNVNLASRLEGLNKEYGTEIIISEDTYKWVSHAFVCRPLDWVAVKGKSRPSLIYELMAHVSSTTPQMMEKADLFTQAFQLYHERDFDGASHLFEMYLEKYDANDLVAKMHLATCKDYAIHPPRSDWTGCRTMTHK